MKSSTPRAHGLDTLRSVAILSVILFHILNYGGEGKLPEWLVPVAKQGWMGVDLFFVLSGSPCSCGVHSGTRLEWKLLR